MSGLLVLVFTGYLFHEFAVTLIIEQACHVSMVNQARRFSRTWVFHSNHAQPPDCSIARSFAPSPIVQVWVIYPRSAHSAVRIVSFGPGLECLGQAGKQTFIVDQQCVGVMFVEPQMGVKISVVAVKPPETGAMGTVFLHRQHSLFAAG